MENLDLTNIKIGTTTFRVYNCNLTGFVFSGNEHISSISFPLKNKHRCPNCGATKLIIDNCEYCGT